MFLKSEEFMVVPIPNMATPRKMAVYPVIHANEAGLKKAAIEKHIITTPMYLTNIELNFLKIFIALPPDVVKCFFVHFLF